MPVEADIKTSSQQLLNECQDALKNFRTLCEQYDILKEKERGILGN